MFATCKGKMERIILFMRNGELAFVFRRRVQSEVHGPEAKTLISLLQRIELYKSETQYFVRENRESLV